MRFARARLPVTFVIRNIKREKKHKDSVTYVTWRLGDWQLGSGSASASTLETGLDGRGMSGDEPRHKHLKAS
jgi:hypothetical protein